jgi:hypothetical protein
MLEATVESVRGRGTEAAAALAVQGADILRDIDSMDDQRRRDAYARALEWYRQAKNFLAGGR